MERGTGADRYVMHTCVCALMTGPSVCSVLKDMPTACCMVVGIIWMFHPDPTPNPASLFYVPIIVYLLLCYRFTLNYFSKSEELNLAYIRASNL